MFTIIHPLCLVFKLLSCNRNKDLTILFLRYYSWLSFCFQMAQLVSYSPHHKLWQLPRRSDTISEQSSYTVVSTSLKWSLGGNQGHLQRFLHVFILKSQLWEYFKPFIWYSIWIWSVESLPYLNNSLDFALANKFCYQFLAHRTVVE